MREFCFVGRRELLGGRMKNVGIKTVNFSRNCDMLYENVKQEEQEFILGV